MVSQIAGCFPDLTDRSVLALVGPGVDVLPKGFKEVSFMGGGGSLMGGEEFDGLPAVGVVDESAKVTLLPTPGVVAVVFAVSFETLLSDGLEGKPVLTL